MRRKSERRSLFREAPLSIFPPKVGTIVNKKIPVAAVLLAAVAGLTFAQNHLSVTDTAPAVDGVVSGTEYSLAMDFTGMTLYVNRTKDRLSLAIRANTTGWVGIGTGALVMNGASIYIGYVDSSGKVVFSEQTGRFHTHSDAANPEPVQYALTEKGGVTIMEISLPAADVIKPGDHTLSLITAYGQGDNIVEHHEYRTPVSVTLD